MRTKSKTPSRARPSAEARSPQLRGLTERIVWRAIGDLKPFPGNPRRHPEAQIASLMQSIGRVWTNPILIDESGTILAGHGRLEAAKRLGMSEVPTITVGGLSAAEKRAAVIADNRLPERAVWDFDLLRGHFRDLIEINFDIELTGFSTGEVELALDGKAKTDDPTDDVSGLSLDGPAISRLGDRWELGRHRLVCGDAHRHDDYQRLLGDDVVQMVVTDPPYNATAETDVTALLDQFIRLIIRHSQDGSIHFIFVDWWHLPELLNAARPIYHDWKNLLVWNKNNADQDTFYRSKHELIAAFKNGTAPHIANFNLGRNGRYRTNVLDYSGGNSLHPARKRELDLHAAVKPIALIADLIRDCSQRNGLILDPFGGSGTTILAAERTGRIARVIELAPLAVDVAVRRWEQMTGLQGRHMETGLSFGETETRQYRETGLDAAAGPSKRRPT
jgi:DNA modification methylase